MQWWEKQNRILRTQTKLLICPCRGRENWSSKQIKINRVTGNKRSRLQKNTKLYIIFDLEKMLFIPSLSRMCFLGAGQIAYSEVLGMFKLLYRNNVQREWVLACGPCTPSLTSVLLHPVNSVGCHWGFKAKYKVSNSPEWCRNPVAFPSMSCCDYIRQQQSHL